MPHQVTHDLLLVSIYIFFFSQAFITRASSMYFSIGLVWSLLIILHSGHVLLPSVGAALILIYMRLPYSYFSRVDFVVEVVHLF